MGGYTFHGTPPPGSGALMVFIMRILANYNFDGKSIPSLQLMIESFKHGYAKRGNLGDPNDDRFTKAIQDVRYSQS